MLKTFSSIGSILKTLAKIGSLVKEVFSLERKNSSSQRPSSKSIHGPAIATGDNSNVNVQIGDVFPTPPDTEKDAGTQFNNRLRAVAHELPNNFRHVGNAENPFVTKALEKLVHDEPLTHQDSELFEKASKCLSKAQILNTSKNPKLRPAQGQSLMKELAQFITDKYGIQAPD